MKKTSPEEVEKLARLSGLLLSTEEKEIMALRINEILGHVEEILTVDCKASQDSMPQLQVNVFREDIAQNENSNAILEQAPKEMHHFFSVPLILDQNE